MFEQTHLLDVVLEPGTRVALGKEAALEHRVHELSKPSGHAHHHRGVVLRAVALAGEAVVQGERLDSGESKIADTGSNLYELSDLLEHTTFDVALIDVQLGEHSAADIVRHWLLHDPNAPIVLCTGLGRFDHGLTEAVNSGTPGFVLKTRRGSPQDDPR